MSSTLPPEILALVEMSPIEDLMLGLLPSQLPGISVKTLIKDNQTFPLVVVRRSGDWGEWAGDPRFLDAGQITVHTFCEGLNGDSDAALLAEAMRVILYRSINKVVPGKGHLTKCKMIAAPRRVTDWATATGPVQFADLPTGVWRYETTYQVEIRKPPRTP